MTENWKHGEERRKHVRLKKNIPVQVAYRSVSGESEQFSEEEAFILNISASGVCLEVAGLDEKLKEDLLYGRVIVALEMNLPGEEQLVKVLAKAVWITKADGQMYEGKKGEKFLMGARFIEITSQQEELITQYIIRHFLKSS